MLVAFIPQPLHPSIFRLQNSFISFSFLSFSLPRVASRAVPPGYAAIILSTIVYYGRRHRIESSLVSKILRRLQFRHRSSTLTCNVTIFDSPARLSILSNFPLDYLFFVFTVSRFVIFLFACEKRKKGNYSSLEKASLRAREISNETVEFTRFEALYDEARYEQRYSSHARRLSHKNGNNNFRTYKQAIKARFTSGQRAIIHGCERFLIRAATIV